MSEFVTQATAFKPRSAVTQLQTFREQALNQWLDSHLPNRKTEAWRYLSLRALTGDNYFRTPAETPLEDKRALLTLSNIPGLDCYTVVMFNGSFEPALSSLPDSASGLQVSAFSDLSADVLSPYLNSAFNHQAHPFSHLNACHFADGLFVKAAKNAVIDKPLHLVNLVSKQPEKFNVSPRVLVIAQSGSQVSVIEHYISDEAEQSCFVNGISEYCVEEGAQANLYRLDMLQESAIQISGVHAALAKNASLNSFFLSLGSRLQRCDISVNFRGAGAQANLQGVYLPRNDQQVDYHTCIEHCVPHCTSNEVFRGIVSDNAKAVFNGRIHIHRDAQKTLAQLSNKNLLTSNKAEVDTKPELEIYADDVQCAHGATVAQLDETALHYLTTRGVSREEATVMLSFGFINELIEKIQLAEIGSYLRPVLAKRFASKHDLARHLL
ncbi:MAG: Fe-S cluster assembly protein SufD [Cellvibrionaceae bacterium]|nr:Fe-S cluster assembly protein SufD [Cellvibrionaceae bacterium]